VPGAEREIQLEPRSAPKDGDVDDDGHDRFGDRRVPERRTSS
jgi:hypothetical protein